MGVKSSDRPVELRQDREPFCMLSQIMKSEAVLKDIIHAVRIIC
jgi:hypothetical protein